MASVFDFRGARLESVGVDEVATSASEVLEFSGSMGIVPSTRISSDETKVELGLSE